MSAAHPNADPSRIIAPMDEDRAKEAARQAGRFFASRRKHYKKRCPVCGTEFEGTARAVYDKPSCRAKAHYDRRARRR